MLLEWAGFDVAPEAGHLGIGYDAALGCVDRTAWDPDRLAALRGPPDDGSREQRLLPEAADPYCLRPGEAATLLAGHPWRRFAVLGDSIAEGVGDPVPGYEHLGWADRVAAALRQHRPDLAVL